MGDQLSFTLNELVDYVITTLCTFGKSVITFYEWRDIKL